MEQGPADVDPEVSAIGTAIVEAATDIHRRFGPGMLEMPYRKCLAYLLRERGHSVREEVWLPLVFFDLRFERAYRLDLLVDERVIVEVKATPDHPVHRAQVLSYLRLTNLTLGYVLNFHHPLMKEGIDRVANGWARSPSSIPLETPGVPAPLRHRGA